MRTVHALLGVLILTLLCPSFARGETRKEARAMWACRWDVTTPKEVENLVNGCAKHGYNAIIIQVRGSADTIYPSEIEPRSRYITDLSFDPLKYSVETAHAKGIRVHAWLNTTYCYYSSKRYPNPDHVTNTHPEWLMVDWNGKTIMDSGADTEGSYLCPARLDAREHIASVFLEVARKYDVDGVHFDFVRYPNRRVCYCDVCLKRFSEQMKQKIRPEEAEVLDRSLDRRAYAMAYPREYEQFRRDQITALVGDVYHRTKAIKPWMEVSASVFANSEDAANERMQEWKRWMKDGIVDFLCPMAYSSKTANVQAQIKDAVDSSCGRAVWAGLGAWLMTPEKQAEQIQAVREVGAVGIALFSSVNLINDGTNEDYMNKLDQLVFQEPAVVPEMSWVPSR